MSVVLWDDSKGGEPHVVKVGNGGEWKDGNVSRLDLLNEFHVDEVRFFGGLVEGVVA